MTKILNRKEFEYYVEFIAENAMDDRNDMGIDVRTAMLEHDVTLREQLKSFVIENQRLHKNIEIMDNNYITLTGKMTDAELDEIHSRKK